jgi:hypothetical protein
VGKSTTRPKYRIGYARPILDKVEQETRIGWLLIGGCAVFVLGVFTAFFDWFFSNEIISVWKKDKQDEKEKRTTTLAMTSCWLSSICESTKHCEKPPNSKFGFKINEIRNKILNLATCGLKGFG